MEATTLFLLLLLPPADTAGDMAAAIQASLRHELGDVSMVIAPDTLVTPSMWQGENASMRARFVVHLVRKDADHVKIDLLAGTDATSKTHEESRDLTFATEDDKSERGRAVGLVIAELLRSSPTSAWADGHGPPQATGPSRVELGGMFATERAASGIWAYGPALTYGFGLSEALQIRAAALVLFGSHDQYRDMGVTVGANWDFLRLAENRYAVGVGISAGYAYESATATLSSAQPGSDSGHSATASLSQSNAIVGASLRGRATIWRSLRFVAEGELRLYSGSLTGPKSFTGDDNKTVQVRSPLSYSRWRPTLWVGLELAM
jgi:hypothetical protein